MLTYKNKSFVISCPKLGIFFALVGILLSANTYATCEGKDKFWDKDHEFAWEFFNFKTMGNGSQAELVIQKYVCEPNNITGTLEHKGFIYSGLFKQYILKTTATANDCTFDISFSDIGSYVQDSYKENCVKSK